MPLEPHGVVKSSSVPTRTLPFLIPEALTEPSVGRPELCISITGCAVPRRTAAAGDEDRVERRRPADPVLVRVAVPAARGVAADAAAAADPGDALVVLVDVVRVVGVAVVAPQVDRLVGHLRVVRVAQVGDPDRPAVADEPVRHRLGGVDRAEPGERGVVRARRTAGPDVPAVLDAARRVAGRQRDEVADLAQVRRVGVGDDVEAALALRIRRSCRRCRRAARRAERRCGAGRARR